MREGAAERSSIALTRRSVSGADHGAECARMERDGERIEAVTAQPDKQDAETQQRHAVAGARQAREDEQPFGVNAA